MFSRAEALPAGLRTPARPSENNHYSPPYAACRARRAVQRCTCFWYPPSSFVADRGHRRRRSGCPPPPPPSPDTNTPTDLCLHFVNCMSFLGSSAQLGRVIPPYLRQPFLPYLPYSTPHLSNARRRHRCAAGTSSMGDTFNKGGEVCPPILARGCSEKHCFWAANTE